VSAKRILRFYGYGYGQRETTIMANVDEEMVHRGQVPTTHEHIHDPFGQYVLFETEIDYNFHGVIPVAIRVIDGTLVLAQVFGNHGLKMNPVYTPEEFEILINPRIGSRNKIPIYAAHANPPLPQTVLDALQAHVGTMPEGLLKSYNLELTVLTGEDEFYPLCADGDSRKNVVINGKPQARPEGLPEDACGDYSWHVPAGSTILFDLHISPRKQAEAFR
jgi:hypothetical protein